MLFIYNLLQNQSNLNFNHKIIGKYPNDLVQAAPAHTLPISNK